MEEQYSILEDAARDMFARAVWSHKIQEKQALYNYYVNYLRYSSTIQAPGSNDSVDLRTSKECLEKVLYKMTQ